MGQQPPLPWHPHLHSRTLPNGMELRVISNHTPQADRLQVYLEVKAGSLHEKETQQGIAHFVEHAVFLGTEAFPTAEHLKARLAALGMSFGADSNAFTDFRQTVYTLNCCLDPSVAAAAAAVDEDALNALSKRSGLSTRAPLSSPPRRSSVAGGSGSGSSTHASPPAKRCTRLQAAQQQSHTLSAALEILFELAFKATFPEQAVHTERGAVLSELQARDTPAYRSEVAYLTQLRPGSLLPARLPIGRKEQIQTWGVSELREFYDTHYRADNLRLYIVGPVDATAALQCAADRFAHAANANPHQAKPPPPLPAHALCLRPPVERVVVHQDALLTQFELTVAALVPLTPVTTEHDLRVNFVDGIIMQALSARLDALQQAEAAPPFLAAGWDYEDSFRDGCGTMTFGVTAALPEEWPAAVLMAFRELHRMARHGVTAAELRHTVASMLRDSKMDAEQVNTTPSSSLMECLLEATAVGEVMMDSRQDHYFTNLFAHPPACSGHEPVTLHEVNARAAEVLRFAVEMTDGDSGVYITPSNGKSSKNRGLRRAAASAAAAALATKDKALAARTPAAVFVSAPTKTSDSHGAQPLVVSAAEVMAVMRTALREVPPPPVVDVPEELLSQDHLEMALRSSRAAYCQPDEHATAAASAADVAAKQPATKRQRKSGTAATTTVKGSTHGTPEGEQQEKAASMGRWNAGRWRPPRHVDAASGVVTMKMSNGMRVVHKTTPFECGHLSVQLTVRGGRALEAAGCAGALSVGMQALLGGGAAGFSAEIGGGVTAEEMWLRADTAVSDGGLPRALELLRIFLMQCLGGDGSSAVRVESEGAQWAWDAAACERAKRDYCLGHEMMRRDLDLRCGARLVELMTPDHRFIQPAPAAVKALTPAQFAAAVSAQLTHGAVHVVAVGDFDARELEQNCLLYLGSVALHPPPVVAEEAAADQVVAGVGVVPEVTWGKLGTSATVQLTDGASRATAVLAMPSADYWGRMPTVSRTAGENGVAGQKRKKEGGSGEDEANETAEERAASAETRQRWQHPLWPSRALSLLSAVIEARLFKQVREDKGLVYSITFSIRQYESCFRHGVAVVQLNPDPNQVDATLAATRTSLLSLLEGPPTPQELREAQAPLITGIRTAMQHNEWWLGRCTSLAHHGGHGDAGLASLRGVPEFYAALGLADVRRAARLYLPAHNLQRAWTVVGISGTELPPK